MSREVFEEELGVAELLTKAGDIFFKNIGIVFIFTLLLIFPVGIVAPILGGTEYMYSMMNILAAFMLGVVTVAAILIVKKSIISTDELEIEMNEIFSKFWLYLYTIILAWIVKGILSIFIIPGIIWNVFYTFVGNVVVIKGIHGINALKYSQELVKGQWWKTCIKSFLITSIYLVCNFIGVMVIEPAANLIGFKIFFLIAGFIIYPLNIYMTMIYSVYFINADYLKNKTISLEKKIENEII